jgi:hypothetical protein
MIKRNNSITIWKLLRKLPTHLTISILLYCSILLKKTTVDHPRVSLLTNLNEKTVDYNNYLLLKSAKYYLKKIGQYTSSIRLIFEHPL